MEHLILIRFNLENERSIDNKINLDEDWLNNRIDKFMMYTYPSLLNQTNQNFKAYIFVHKDTPKHLYDKLKNMIRMDNVFILDVNNKTEAREELFKLITTTDYVLQTRFDSDDIYNINLIDIIQKNTPLYHKSCLIFDNLLYYDEKSKQFYLLDNLITSSNVTTVVEHIDELKLYVVGRNHGHYGSNPDEFNLKYISDKSPYALVIHKDNDKGTISAFEGRVKREDITNVTTNVDIIKQFRFRRTMKILRTDIINDIFDKYIYNSYLEIGVRNANDNFKLIHADHKDGVDPKNINDIEFVMTSDEFFGKHADGKKYDVIFIDGMHTKEQMYIDVQNSIDHLNDNGFIVIHDCNPPTKFHSRTYKEFLEQKGGWNGDVYKGFIKLKHELKNWNCFVVDENYGCGIITKHSLSKTFAPLETINENIEWEEFNENNIQLLDLIPYGEFKNIL